MPDEPTFPPELNNWIVQTFGEQAEGAILDTNAQIEQAAQMHQELYGERPDNMQQFSQAFEETRTRAELVPEAPTLTPSLDIDLERGR